MKMLLRLVFLLTVSVFVGYTASADLTQTDRQAVEDGFNKIRLAFAKKRHIGNMHEIKYDMGLEKKAKEMSECKLLNGDGYMHFYAEAGKNLETLDPKEFEPMIEPLQTKFGFAEIEDNCDKQGMKAGDELYLTGPHSSYSDPKKGPVGSQCPGAKNKDGLCISGGSGSGDAAKSGTDVSYLGSLVAYLSIALMTLF
ncbi:hypothetical protein CRE_21801 [Caenorhabditis remanei]|uniref:Uncharacterized protein n=1 Tax=Caenorhabditis remanei TaxID=31234 RepID=E3MEJ7_CAERE|nr:hypothetical protein CRE_21801 [Caenorhabditis remanei]